MTEQEQFRTTIILVAIKMLAWGWKSSDGDGHMFQAIVNELNTNVDVDLVIKEMKEIEIDCLL